MMLARLATVLSQTILVAGLIGCNASVVDSSNLPEPSIDSSLLVGDYLFVSKADSTVFVGDSAFLQKIADGPPQNGDSTITFPTERSLISSSASSGLVDSLAGISRSSQPSGTQTHP